MKERSPFASLMRSARRSSDITLAQVAAHLGCSIGYVSDVENDARKPPASARIVAWARFIGADVADAIMASGRPVEVMPETRDQAWAALRMTGA